MFVHVKHPNSKGSQVKNGEDSNDTIYEQYEELLIACFIVYIVYCIFISDGG